MKINPYIFREYDIRGVVERDFPDELVVLLGQGFGTFAQERGGKRIVISGDVRLTTPGLKEKFTEGLLKTGIEVIDIGIVPTPANYFSMYHLDVDGAVQITGSHNPPEFNGFKLSFQKAAVYGQDIQKIRRLIEQNNLITGEGKYSQVEVLSAYKQAILDRIKLELPVRIALDAGNATAALIAPQLFKELGCEVTELYCDVDGTFPNHHPDPTVTENLTDIIAVVKKGGYDAGIAFDGDADRIGVIDDKGNIIWADYLMILFLEEVIKNGETIVFDVKCSQALEEMIIARGGKPYMWKTGHSLIKEKMRELQVPFAGEMSGHIFFADDYFGYDDAIYVAARLVQLISRHSEPLSEMVAALPHYYSTPEMRLEVANDQLKFKLAEKAAAYFKSKYECIDVDGVRIKFGDGWGLVRASNTQPVIVCRFEARTPERLEELKNLVLGKLKEFENELSRELS